MPEVTGRGGADRAQPPPLVLLVEDDPDIAAYTGTVLRHLVGARVIDGPSAETALNALAAEPDVDLVVTAGRRGRGRGSRPRPPR